MQVLRKPILTFLLFSLCATAAHAEAEGPEALWAMLGKFVASCDNMTVVRLTSDNWESGSGEKLDADISKCNTHLKPTSVFEVYQPVVDSLFKLQVEEPVLKNPFQELKEVFDKWRFDLATKQTHERARPLFEACKAAMGNLSRATPFICYFGGPTLTSNTSFKAHFQTLFTALLPSSEAICTPDPIRQETAVSEIFTRILDKDETTLGWWKLQTSLQAEGYVCSNNSCYRQIMGIYIPSEVVRQSEEFRRNKIEFLIIPRILTIYRGDWRPLGAFGCLENTDGTKSGTCQPSKGVSSGICMSVEGGPHGLGFLIMLINGIE